MKAAILKKSLLGSMMTGLMLIGIVSLSQAQNKILILGSSTSGCFGLANKDECYVERLKNYMSAVSPVTIDNRAVGGWSVYKSMPKGYIPPPGRDTPAVWYNITDALAAKPDMIIVNYPSNGYDVFTVAEVMHCFRTIKNAADAAGKKCYITTSQPRNNFTTENRKKLREIKDSVLKQFGVFAIDFWTGLADSVTNMIVPSFQIPGDPIHMNAAAHEVMFKRVIAKTMSTAAAAPMPAFGELKGELNNNKVDISWKSSAFHDIKNFRVEHSIGSKFMNIGNLSVNPQSDYSFTHTQPSTGKNLYRIIGVHSDGQELVSDTLEIMKSKNGLVSIAWARTDQNIRIVADLRQSITLHIMNSMGQVLLMRPVEMLQGLNNIPVSIKTTPGVYIVRVKGRDWTSTSQHAFNDK